MFWFFFAETSTKAQFIFSESLTPSSCVTTLVVKSFLFVTRTFGIFFPARVHNLGYITFMISKECRESMEYVRIYPSIPKGSLEGEDRVFPGSVQLPLFYH